MIKKEIETERVLKSRDWKGFLAEFQDESDRATAILGGVFLDEHLRQLIADTLAGEKRIANNLLDGPLQNFATRGHLAYCLNLINATEHADIELIVKIRNAFAHRLQRLSFEDPEIRKLCKQFKTTRSMLDIISPKGSSPRFSYIATVYTLSGWLAMYRMSAEAAKKERLT